MIGSRLQNMSIRKKLMALMVGMSAIPLCIAVGLSVYFSVNDTTKELLKLNQLRSESVGRQTAVIVVLCRGFVNDARTVKTREDGRMELINTP